MYVSGDMLENCSSSKGCHMCKSPKLSLVLDLGSQPHSDDFLDESRLREFECLYPLRLVSCEECGLLQIDYFVDPRILYQTNYVYESSTTVTGSEHYRRMAQEVGSRFDDAAGKLAVDIGSNVGVLLEAFKHIGFSVVGVDPAQHAASIATFRGIKTINDFFTIDVAERILRDDGAASIVTGTNVFAHLHDIDSATEGIKKLLDSNGILVIEAPYALDLVQNLEYDTIYHQHIAYLSVHPMQRYFAAHGLELYDIESQSIHGGTLRYFVQHPGARPVSSAVAEYIEREKAFGLYDMTRLGEFSRSVRAQRASLIELLVSLKHDGKRIVGVSAPAKGNTLLNFCHIDRVFLDYVTERNVSKIGKYTPGTHIPIVSDSVLDSDTPDYALLLAWNFAPEIMENLSGYTERGGKFIIPVPVLRIV